MLPPALDVAAWSSEVLVAGPAFVRTTTKYEFATGSQAAFTATLAADSESRCGSKRPDLVQKPFLGLGNLP